jgi:hypothetical protein
MALFKDPREIVNSLKTNIPIEIPEDFIKELIKNKNSFYELREFSEKSVKELKEYFDKVEYGDPNKSTKEIIYVGDNVVNNIKNLLNDLWSGKEYLIYGTRLLDFKRQVVHFPIDKKKKDLLQDLMKRFQDFCSNGGLGYWSTSYMLLSAIKDAEFDDYDEILKFLGDNTHNWDIEENNLRGLQKFCYCHRSCRKYNKLTTTYVEGMLIEGAKNCAEYDENGVSISRWGDGTAWKVFPRYFVCSKKSKRWLIKWLSINLINCWKLLLDSKYEVNLKFGHLSVIILEIGTISSL